MWAAFNSIRWSMAQASFSRPHVLVAWPGLASQGHLVRAVDGPDFIPDAVWCLRAQALPSHTKDSNIIFQCKQVNVWLLSLTVEQGEKLGPGSLAPDLSLAGSVTCLLPQLLHVRSYTWCVSSLAAPQGHASVTSVCNGEFSRYCRAQSESIARLSRVRQGDSGLSLSAYFNLTLCKQLEFICHPYLLKHLVLVCTGFI